MELNDYKDPKGVIATENMADGRFVLITTHSYTRNFGSLADLPGVKLPDTAEEAKRAIYMVGWAPLNMPLPMFSTYPSLSFALRGGWDQTANLPFNADVYVTYPGHKEGTTIPAGTGCLAYQKGVFTLVSGEYIDSTEIHSAGAPVIVANTAEDGSTEAGKLKYQATVDERVVGYVENYNSTTFKLRVATRS